ncbi:MAG: two-component regulator propeller domain-containing protein [Candidatus Edwardsbacteria bacterium]
MNSPLFHKKVTFLFLFAISMFCFSQVSFADIIAPGYASHSIDFTSRYVFIATDYGINTYDKKSQRWEAIPSKIHEKNTILETKYTYPPTNSFLAVKVHNKVWFGSYQKGAYMYDLITGELVHYEGYHMVYNDRTKREERKGNCRLLDNVINSIVVDRRNNVWFATNLGVSKLTNKGCRNYLSRSYPPQEQKAIMGGDITCMEIDQDGHIWLGRSDFHYAYYDADPPEMVVDGGVSVFDGEKWIHYYAKIYDLENPDESHIKTELISNDVRCLAIDNEEVWIGTSKGISVYNKKMKKWRSYTTENSGIISNSITSLAVGEDTIWIATDSGISKYHKINNRWTNYGSNIFPALNIKSIGYCFVN